MNVCWPDRCCFADVHSTFATKYKYRQVHTQRPNKAKYVCVLCIYIRTLKGYNRTKINGSIIKHVKQTQEMFKHIVEYICKQAMQAFTFFCCLVYVWLLFFYVALSLSCLFSRYYRCFFLFHFYLVRSIVYVWVSEWEWMNGKRALYAISRVRTHFYHANMFNYLKLNGNSAGKAKMLEWAHVLCLNNSCVSAVAISVINEKLLYWGCRDFNTQKYIELNRREKKNKTHQRSKNEREKTEHLTCGW